MYCDASKESSAKTFTIPIPESYYSYVGNIRRDSIGHILMYLAGNGVIHSHLTQT